jgi:hypothetical protein
MNKSKLTLTKLPEPSTAPRRTLTPGKITHLSAIIDPVSNTTRADRFADDVSTTVLDPNTTSSPTYEGINAICLNSAIIKIYENCILTSNKSYSTISRPEPGQ